MLQPHSYIARGRGSAGASAPSTQMDALPQVFYMRFSLVFFFVIMKPGKPRFLEIVLRFFRV